MKKLIMVWGRMNPIHKGHSAMLSQTKRRAQEEGAEFRVFLSRTQDETLNPLSYRNKMRFLKMIVGCSPVEEDRDTSNIFGLVGALSKEYSEIEMVFGGDQAKKFKPLIEKYQDDFSCPVNVTCFAERNVIPMSATKMRQFAREGKWKEFMEGCPEIFTPNQKLSMYHSVATGLTKTVKGRTNA